MAGAQARRRAAESPGSVNVGPRAPRSSGDGFAIPVAVGIGIGRIGCVLAGLDDPTHGLPTSLPWAVDYGDGIPRHPAQLYEIAFVWLLAFGLAYYARLPRREGDLFRAFMVAYLGFRLP